jgi:hypothetical protein
MSHALVNLTKLDCIVSGDGSSGALFMTAAPLFEILRGVVRLKKESKAGIWTAYQGSSGIRMTNLKDLGLQVATDKDALTRFLAAYKETFRTLTLAHVGLTCLGDARTSFDDLKSAL